MCDVGIHLGYVYWIVAAQPYRPCLLDGRLVLHNAQQHDIERIYVDATLAPNELFVARLPKFVPRIRAGDSVSLAYRVSSMLPHFALAAEVSFDVNGKPKGCHPNPS